MADSKGTEAFTELCLLCRLKGAPSGQHVECCWQASGAAPRNVNRPRFASSSVL